MNCAITGEEKIFRPVGGYFGNFSGSVSSISEEI
jgi:hypothetical protein